jgi:hypothetical protein
VTGVPAAPGRPLPDGFAVRLDPRTDRREDGVLLGGSPSANSDWRRAPRR